MHTVSICSRTCACVHSSSLAATPASAAGPPLHVSSVWGQATTGGPSLWLWLPGRVIPRLRPEPDSSVPMACPRPLHGAMASDKNLQRVQRTHQRPGINIVCMLSKQQSKCGVQGYKAALAWARTVALRSLLSMQDIDTSPTMRLAISGLRASLSVQLCYTLTRDAACATCRFARIKCANMSSSLCETEADF